MSDDCGSTVQIVYDSECPACNAYCSRIRPETGEGPQNFQVIDARGSSEIMREITQRGWDIDQGMVVVIDGKLHYGAHAIHALAVVSDGSGLFGRLNQWLFRAPSRAQLLYPVLRDLRSLLLRAMGKRKINNLRVAGNDRF